MRRMLMILAAGLAAGCTDDPHPLGPREAVAAVEVTVPAMPLQLDIVTDAINRVLPALDDAASQELRVGLEAVQQAAADGDLVALGAAIAAAERTADGLHAGAAAGAAAELDVIRLALTQARVEAGEHAHAGRARRPGQDTRGADVLAR